VRVSAGEPPSGIVTFLFTDIEGSTRRWEADADAMRAALLAHDGVLRNAIEAHGGFLFSHTGDGVVAAFASPRSAVDAAVTAQLALELPVRMGIATGEAELRDGDYFGTVLNRAARVMAAGHGGQILVADSTAGLVGGVDLADLGPRRLRDLPNPITLFQLRASGLPTEFPPLRTLDPSPGNLRPQTTSLIGRESELTDIQTALRAHRLVTLTGVGGVGKTRLAMEVAAQLIDEFPDGVWVFELAAVTDPSAVPDAVAAVLGITQQPGKTVSESVATALEGRVRLLVFDNCEHVLDAAADLIEAILTQSATVRMLATSREGLGIAEEQVQPVRSLDAAAGIDSAAVRLFSERAQGIAPGFTMVDDKEGAAVTEICQRLDGIPLAIELAASRMASMTASEMRDRLDYRFRLLVGSRRGTERHQTLRHAVAWSYDLLDDTEKTVLQRCSVFAGGFHLQSVCAVAGSNELDEYALLDVLDALVRKSLIVADRSSGRTRYSMLETIRQFAEEQLVVGGEASEIRAAHSRYFAGREADILALWDSPRQREAYDWFTTELPNLRTAFRWAADHDDLDVAISVAWCASFFGVWVEQYEPVAWIEEIIEAARAVRHRRLVQLYVLAAQSYATGRLGDALAYFETGEQLSKSSDFDAAAYEGQYSSGVVYSVAGHPERWVALCRRATAAQTSPLTVTCGCLCIALYLSGKGDEARLAADGLLAAADATDNPNTACFALMGHGAAYMDSDPAAAYHSYRRALKIARETGNRQLETAVATMQCVLMANEDDPFFGAPDDDTIDPLDYLTVTIRRYHDAGNATMIQYPLTILAAVFDRLGHHEQAAIITGFAATEMARAGYPQITTTIAHLGEVLGHQTYESLAHKGETMTTAEMVAYAYDQIDQARIELNGVSK
jgi:predicted ATPase/class 3 adenylate cyclase